MFSTKSNLSTKRLKRSKYNPTIDYDEKVISSSEKNYQSHEKRKTLMINSGFNEKGFTFFMEDTCLKVDDYFKFYNQNDNITNILQNSKTKPCLISKILVLLIS
jgi:hypothetical protein